MSSPERWPQVDGVIENLLIEVDHSGDGDVRTPVVSFSYTVNGERYSGVFALEGYLSLATRELFEGIAGMSLPVKHNPKDPAKWYIGVSEIGGFRIEQRLGPHFRHHSERD